VLFETDADFGGESKMTKQMSYEEVSKVFDKIKVVLNDGSKYYLKEYFPFVMSVANEPDLLYLDTGGRMTECDFFIGKIVDNELIRKCDDGTWRKIATLEIPIVNKVK